MGVVVSTRIHRQNADGYCGAASAQMALASLGMDPSQLAQNSLYSASHEKPWYSRPDLLTETLNDQWQNAKDLRFRLYRCADRAGMVGVMRRMFEQFGDDGAVAIALTMSTHHWVVVRGFETHPDDPTKLIGFHVRNPMPSLQGNPVDWPHAKDDDCCAQQGMCPTCHYMSLARWNREVEPVSVDSDWKDEFLVICPDRVVPGMSDEVMVPTTPDGEADPAPPSGPILSVQEVEARVQDMISHRDDNPFLTRDCISGAVTRTQPSTPILVEGLNRDGSVNPDDAYYLVPFVDPDGDWGDSNSVPMAMTVNAVTGEFEEVIATPDGSIYDPAWITPAGIERQALGNNLDRLRRRTQPDAAFSHVAVWRHTEQTPTRFWPLFIGERTVIDAPTGGPAPDARSDAPPDEIEAGMEPINTVNATVFMRIDGQVVTDLREMHP